MVSGSTVRRAVVQSGGKGFRIKADFFVEQFEN